MEQNTPQNTNPPQHVPPNQPTSTVARQKRSALVLITLVIAVLAAGISGAALAMTASKADKNASSQEIKTLKERLATLEEQEKFEAEHVDEDAYQAVFLTGGQVYFGYITEIGKDTIKLEKIYYLNTGTVDREGNGTAGDDVSLVKLGEELHGPEDVMMIERKNVQFWENLKNDSQVSKAMDEYKRSNPRAR